MLLNAERRVLHTGRVVSILPRDVFRVQQCYHYHLPLRLLSYGLASLQRTIINYYCHSDVGTHEYTTTTGVHTRPWHTWQHYCFRSHARAFYFTKNKNNDLPFAPITQLLVRYCLPCLYRTSGVPERARVARLRILPPRVNILPVVVCAAR